MPSEPPPSRVISHHELNTVYYEQNKFVIKQECNTNCIIYEGYQVACSKVRFHRKLIPNNPKQPAAGLFNDLDDVRRTWQAEAEFAPQMSDEQRSYHMNLWNQALRRV